MVCWERINAISVSSGLGDRASLAAIMQGDDRDEVTEMRLVELQYVGNLGGWLVETVWSWRNSVETVEFDRDEESGVNAWVGLRVMGYAFVTERWWWWWKTCVGMEVLVKRDCCDCWVFWGIWDFWVFFFLIEIRIGKKKLFFPKWFTFGRTGTSSDTM